MANVKSINGYDIKDEVARKMLNYSFSEVNTGCKWVDNKNIYKKTFKYQGTLSAHSSIFIDNSIITDASEIIKMEGTTFRSAYTVGITETHPTSNSQMTFYEGQILNTYYDNTRGIALAVGGYTYTNATVYVTLYYTK